MLGMSHLQLVNPPKLPQEVCACLAPPPPSPQKHFDANVILEEFRLSGVILIEPSAGNIVFSRWLMSPWQFSGFCPDTNLGLTCAMYYLLGRHSLQPPINPTISPPSLPIPQSQPETLNPAARRARARGAPGEVRRGGATRGEGGLRRGAGPRGPRRRGQRILPKGWAALGARGRGEEEGGAKGRPKGNLRLHLFWSGSNGVSFCWPVAGLLQATVRLLDLVVCL